MEADNPCFGCVAIEKGKRIKAPCCHEVSLVVDEEEYFRLFLTLFLQSLISVDEMLDRETGEMFYAIQVIGACFYLSLETGECLVNESKPKACARAKTGHFSTCVK